MIYDYSPFLIRFTDNFGLRYYSLAYLLGTLLTYIWLVYVARYDKDKLADYTLYGFLAIVIGGRLGELFFYHPEWLWTNPLQIIKIWEGGMSFHGGFIAVFFWTWYFLKKQKWDFLEFSDALVVPAAFGLALANIGNFFNSELWGVETTVPWCFEVPGKAGCLHPSQLYQALGNITLSLFLLFFYRRPHKKGLITALFIIGYGLARITVEVFWRVPDWAFWGISSGTWLSIPMVGVGVVLLFRICQLRAETLRPPAH